MIVIDEAITAIKKMGPCGGHDILARALYSACHHGSFPGPSLLDVSVVLDIKNTKLFLDLCLISRQPDYSNKDQSEAVKWLVEYVGSDVIAGWGKA